MANDAPFIGIQALTELGRTIMPDIAMGAYYDRKAFFDKMYVKVISGDEFRNIRYMILTKGHTSRQWTPGSTIENTAGMMVEREMKTYIAWNRFRANAKMFRELPKMIGDQVSYPNSEAALRVALEDYVGDVFDNIVFGNHEYNDLPETSGLRHLGLFDGWMTDINNDIEAGIVVPISLSAAISEPTSIDDIQAWTIFKEFRAKLDPALRGAAKLLFMMNSVTAEAIATAYANSKGNHKELGVNNLGNYTIPEMPNVEICFDDAWGDGCKMIATVPENLEYGIDTRNPENGVSVMAEPSRDNDDLIIQPQSAQGTRVFRTDKKHFAITSAELSPVSLAHDYHGSNCVVVSSNQEYGKVTVNDVEPENLTDYKPGVTLTLKAEPTEAGKFLKWSNGSTETTLTVVTKGTPESYVAFFDKKG